MNLTQVGIKTPHLKILVEDLSSNSLNSKALRGTAAGRAVLEKAQQVLEGGGGGSASWQRFSAPLDPTREIVKQRAKEQLEYTRSRAGDFKVGFDAHGPSAGYKSVRKARAPNDATKELARTTKRQGGGWAEWAEEPPRVASRVSSAPARRLAASASAPRLSAEASGSNSSSRVASRAGSRAASPPSARAPKAAAAAAAAAPSTEAGGAAVKGPPLMSGGDPGQQALLKRLRFNHEATPPYEYPGGNRALQARCLPPHRLLLLPPAPPPPPPAPPPPAWPCSRASLSSPRWRRR